MLMILATVLSLAFQAPAPAYERGDIAELVRAPGDSALPDVRIVAVPGDRLQADVRGIRVNDQTVQGCPSNCWNKSLNRGIRSCRPATTS